MPSLQSQGEGIGSTSVPACSPHWYCCHQGSYSRVSGFLTILTAPHGGAEDGGILSVVECVAISVHWMVEECEVPMEEEKGSERAGLGLALVHPSRNRGASC